VTEKKLLIYFTPAFDLNVTYLSLIWKKTFRGNLSNSEFTSLCI
jgi:hypothetical protein